MNQLDHYIARQNQLKKHFGEPAMNPNNLTKDDVRSLRLSLECDLSPENLSCDGELPASKVRQRGQSLRAALEILNDLSV